jgi:F-box and leucine-rich repeat protein GRR1
VSSARSNGALTPDLNFAEIGHGRGAYTRRGYDNDVHGSSTQSITQTMNASNMAVAPAPGVYAALASSSSLAAGTVEPDRTPRQADGFTHWINTQRQVGVGAELTPQPTRRELQESIQQALEPATVATAAVEGRGRSVKRSIRNTINVAEHFAGSLFGRGSGGGRDNGGGAAGPSGSGSSAAEARTRMH